MIDALERSGQANKFTIGYAHGTSSSEELAKGPLLLFLVRRMRRLVERGPERSSCRFRSVLTCGSRNRHRRRLWRDVGEGLLDEFPPLPGLHHSHHHCAWTFDLSLVGKVPGMRCCELIMRFG
jgi:hypothetical protein